MRGRSWKWGVPVDGRDVLGLEGVRQAQVAVVGRVTGEAGEPAIEQGFASAQDGDLIGESALGLALAGLHGDAAVVNERGVGGPDDLVAGAGGPEAEVQGAVIKGEVGGVEAA